MAYALLADVPPILGIYVSVFPVLVYAVFGPSPHISMGKLYCFCTQRTLPLKTRQSFEGTNGLACMLASTAVNKYSKELLPENPTEQEDNDARIQVGWKLVDIMYYSQIYVIF